MQGNRRQWSGIAVLIVVVGACGAMALSPLGSVVASAGTSARASSLAPGAAPSPLAPAADPQGGFGGASCTVTVNGENGDDSAIQTAINSVPSGSTVCVSAGTYPEQLTISEPLTLLGAGNASTIIEPSAPLALNTFDYDSSSTYADLTPAAAIVLVANTTGVTIGDLTVSGSAAAATFTGCGVDYYGIDFQASSGKVNGTTVTDIELPPALFGCQPGVELYAYNGYYFTGHVPSPAVAVAVTNSTFSSYDKGGIVCDDQGESCTVARNTVTGVGANASIAQNGIQVAFGASASVTDNAVTGNHYTGPYVSAGDDYFAPGYLSSGILVFDGGNTIQVTSNVLSGNDLGIAVAATAAATVTGNHVEQGFGYGITLDLNASASYVGLPIYGTASSWVTNASNNTLDNVNVGLLAYDDNVTIVGGSMAGVNVGVESLVDSATGAYGMTVDDLSVSANVSGALLGNLSSFQSTAGFVPRYTATLTLVNDVVTANPAAPAASVADGLAVYGATDLVDRCTVSGFAIGIYAYPTAASITVTASVVDEPASLAEPEAGIWAGNLVYPVADDSATVLVSDNSVVGPGGGPGSPVAGGTGIMVGGASVQVLDNFVANFSAVSSPSGYDWWEGTQSAGIQVGCPPGATTCLVEGNTVYNNAIGLVSLLTNATFSGAYATAPITVSGNLFNDSGGYGIFTEMVWAGGPREASLIDNNTFNDTLSGAPAMVLSGQLFEVDNNVLIGTSTSGNQGPSQGQGGGPLMDTASIEATDYWTTGYTTAVLNENLFLDTTVYWNATFAPFATGPSSLSGGVLATFNEVGLPGGTAWPMTIAGTDGTVAAPATMVADLQNSSNPYPFVAGTVPGYTPVPATGGLTANGLALAQTIVYSVATYDVTFTETGVPTGLTWYLNLTNGQHFSSDTTTISFSEPNGVYSYMFGGTLQFPKYFSALPGSFTVNGAAVDVHATFTQSRQVVITEHGLPGGMEWWANFTGPYSFSSNGTTMVLYVPAGSWTYTLQAANHDYHAAGHSFLVHSPLALPHKALHFTANFRVSKYTIEFTETGLPGGSHWCVVVTSGGITCTRGRSLSFSEPNGTYDYTLATSRAGYSAPGGSFTIPTVSSVAVQFSPVGGPASLLLSSAGPAPPSGATGLSGVLVGVVLAALGVGLLVAGTRVYRARHPSAGRA